MSTAYHEILVSDIVPTRDNKRKIDEKAESFIDLKNSIAAGGTPKAKKAKKAGKKVAAADDRR